MTNTILKKGTKRHIKAICGQIRSQNGKTILIIRYKNFAILNSE